MNGHSLTKWVANKSYELAKNPGNMYLYTGVIGWALSAVAQVTAVMINPKIPNDQKKFMIPQEIADAFVNVASFILFTKVCTKIGERFVESGKLATPKIRKFLKENNLTSKIGTEIKEIVNDKAKPIPFNVGTEISNPKNTITDKDKTHYYNFYDGVSFLASVGGSIISCNLVTPILRNKIAANRQKASIEREKMQKEPIMLPDSPVLPAQNKPDKDNRAKLASVNVPRVTTGGSMRV